MPEFISSYTTYDVRYGYNFDNFDSLAVGLIKVTNQKPDRLPILNEFESCLGIRSVGCSTRK
jgi:hypothetical protein